MGDQPIDRRIGVRRFGARWVEIFECPTGHQFEVQFAHDAELPDTWECRNHGHESQRLAIRPTPKAVKPPRTHWDMLLERRSIADLEVLLDEALEKLRRDRRVAAAPSD